MFLSCKDVFKYYLCLYNEGKNKSRYRSLISLKMCPCLNVRNRSVVNEHFMMSIISMFFTISASSQVLEISINLYDQRESFRVWPHCKFVLAFIPQQTCLPMYSLWETKNNGRLGRFLPLFSSP